MKRDEVFPSKYLRAADLQGSPITVTIESATYETLKSKEGKEQGKTVLSFKSGKKVLPLNMTNWDSVAAICGGDDAEWRGCKIELYPSTTPMGGKIVDCIRIRPPAQRELPKAKPRAVKPPEKATATAKAALAEEMDDEIPF